MTQKHPKQKVQNNPGKSSKLIWTCIGVIAIALCALVIWKTSDSKSQPPSDPPSVAVEKENTPLPKVPSKSDEFKKFVGKWSRTDAPYVIEIKGVNEDGKLDAAYYNPRTINVSIAEIRQKNDTMELFLELRDTNYPGSSYTLAYNQATDMFQGVYFQAVMGQNYNVAFRRINTGGN